MSIPQTMIRRVTAPPILAIETESSLPMEERMFPPPVQSDVSLPGQQIPSPTMPQAPSQHIGPAQCTAPALTSECLSLLPTIHFPILIVQFNRCLAVGQHSLSGPKFRNHDSDPYLEAHTPISSLLC